MNAEVDGDDHLSQMARANGKRADDHHIADSHDDRHSIRHSSKQSVTNVDTLGKVGLTVMLVMFGVIVVIGILAGYSLGVGQARHEDSDTRMRTLNAKVEILQYDFDKAQAQLIEKGVIEHTGH